MPRRPARSLLRLSLPLLLFSCSQAPAPSSRPSKASDPYAAGTSYPWSDRLDAPIGDPYTAGRAFPWTGPSTAAPGLGATQVRGGDNFLSDLTWTSATNAWGPVEKDRSNGEQALGDGRVLTIGTQTFAKGLGVHASSTLSYALGGVCQTFSAQVGVDDEVGDRGSVVFQVYGDGVKLYDSGVTRGADAVKAVSVNVTGRSELKLVVTNGGDSIDYDHADWASAKVSCAPPPAPTGERFLSDLAWTSATNAWGPVEKDRSNGEQALGDGRVLTIGTQTFAKGLGVHAASTLSYYLGGACQTFSAQVGVDDEVGDRGSVVFQVYGDGVKLYDSGVTRGADAVKAVSVNVTGRSDL
ncbi:NPCBM/NEW2 domain-containing protein, partial [Deinococcus yavapaiensis]